MAKKKQAPNTGSIISNIIVPQVPLGEISVGAVKEYGNYVNNYRHICRIHDGLKISYRRLIYAALQFPKGKDIPSTTLIASVANWHPHGLTGIEGLNAVLKKSGVFSGEGNFGMKDINGQEDPPAAPRYTKVRISDLYWTVIGDLVKEVAHLESPGGALEPEYIPLPLPTCLYLCEAVTGLGVGIKADYPNFSPKSLYQAYINNNPALLEPGIDLLLDHEMSELDKLWKTGKGRVAYSYKITRQLSPDGKTEGILFQGDTGIFTPNLNDRTLNSLIEAGKVYTESLTDINGPKLFIGRVPGARGITVDDIEKIARKICYSRNEYNINVSNGESVYRIPLYDWIDLMYKNYIDLVTRVNAKNIDKVVFDISVLEALPTISDYILNTDPKASNDQLVKVLGVSAEVVDAVMSKPISYLRKTKEAEERLKSLKAKLKVLKSFNAISHTEEIINML